MQQEVAAEDEVERSELGAQVVCRHQNPLDLRPECALGEREPLRLRLVELFVVVGAERRRPVEALGVLEAQSGHRGRAATFHLECPVAVHRCHVQPAHAAEVGANRAAIQHAPGVDKGSTDGRSDMVRAEFPEVQLIVRDENVGVSGWNDGLAVAKGGYVLALDDDCYLPPDGLRRAVAAVSERDADLASFKVVSSYDIEHAFTDYYRTGLFTFWGCAVLMRRHVIEALGGYDPQIFIWANELEFLLRFFDRGFCHLHFPEVVAVHMKEPGPPGGPFFTRAYCINSRHFAYIAAKLFAPRDAAE